MRRLLATACLALASACALAQQPAAGDDSAAPGRRNQRIERIVHEDAGNRIEEVRYGGQMQSITVQPKGELPEYEVDTGHLSRTRPGDNRNGLSATGGQRSWNVFRF
jgi:hypothetical protein